MVAVILHFESAFLISIITYRNIANLIFENALALESALIQYFAYSINPRSADRWQGKVENRKNALPKEAQWVKPSRTASSIKAYGLGGELSSIKHYSSLAILQYQRGDPPSNTRVLTPRFADSLGALGWLNGFKTATNRFPFRPGPEPEPPRRLFAMHYITFSWKKVGKTRFRIALLE